MKPWYSEETVDASPIISSRIRLARNLQKYPFPNRINAEQSTRMVGEVSETLSGAFSTLPIAEKNDFEQRYLLERHIVSPHFLKINNPKGLLLQPDEKVSVMVNEEDHIRIQAISAGDGIDGAWDTAGKVDDLLEERVHYAFDKDYGYLSACPTNTGTGLRASYMVHLPMLDAMDQLKNLFAAVSKFSMTIRGLHGEGTEPMGHIFQISNQMTLGKSEEDIISSLKTITGQIVESENWLREKAVSEARLEMEDRIFRAYGTLAYARKLSSKEAMELLSEVRLGYLCGVLDKPKPKQTLYQIMMHIQIGALQTHAGHELSEDDRDVARASTLRSIFYG